MNNKHLDSWTQTKSFGKMLLPAIFKFYRPATNQLFESQWIARNLHLISGKYYLVNANADVIVKYTNIYYCNKTVVKPGFINF